MVRMLSMDHAGSGGETTLVTLHHSVMSAHATTPANGDVKSPSASDSWSSNVSLSASHTFDGAVVGKMHVSHRTGHVTGTEKI